MKGVRKFLEEEILEIEGLEPAIDSAAFSLTAWIKLTPERGANVIRKPLGRAAGGCVCVCVCVCARARVRA